jgi:hypothetical protein
MPPPLGLVVDRGYEDQAPYAFTGTVKEVIFDLKPVHLKPKKCCANTRRSKPSDTARRANGRAVSQRHPPESPDLSASPTTGLVTAPGFSQLQLRPPNGLGSAGRCC